MEDIEELFHSRFFKIRHELEQAKERAALLDEALQLTVTAQESRLSLKTAPIQLRSETDLKRSRMRQNQTLKIEEMRALAGSSRESIHNVELFEAHIRSQWELINESDTLIIRTFPIVSGYLDALLVSQILTPDFDLAKNVILELMRQVVTLIIPYADVADRIHSLMEVFQESTNFDKKLSHQSEKLAIYVAALKLWIGATNSILELSHFAEALDRSTEGLA
jgi:hypothetical protein